MADSLPGIAAHTHSGKRNPSSDFAQPIGQWGELILDEVQDQVWIHAEVLVNDDVAKPRDRSPSNVGHPISRLTGKGPDGLANHGQMRRTAS